MCVLFTPVNEMAWDMFARVRGCQHNGGDTLLHLALHLAGIVYPCSVHRAAIALTIVCAVGLLTHGRMYAFSSRLRHHVGKAAVGAPSNACSPGRPGRSGQARLHWASPAHTRAASHQLDDRQRKVGKVVGILLFLRQQKNRSVLSSQVPQQSGAQPAALQCSPTAWAYERCVGYWPRGVLKGSRGSPHLPRKTMNSSHERTLGTILFQVCNLHGHRPCQHHRPGPIVSRSERPVLGSAHPPCAALRVLAVSVAPPIQRCATLGRRRTAPFKPCATTLLMPVAPVATSARMLASDAVPGRIHRVLDDTATRSSFSIQRSNALQASL